MPEQRFDPETVDRAQVGFANRLYVWLAAGFALAVLLVAGIYANVAGQQRLQEMKDSVDKAYDSKDYDAALNLAIEGVERYPKEAFFAFRAGTSLERLDRPEEAIEYLEIAAGDKAYTARSNFLRGMIYHKLEKYQQAASYLQHAIAAGYDPAPANYWLLSSFYELGQYEEAKSAGLQAVQSDPDNWLAWLELGRVHSKLKEFAEAHECFDRVTHLGSGQAEAWYGKGVAFTAERKFTKAKEVLLKAIKLKPDWEAPRNLLASLASDPEHKPAHN